MELDVGDSKGQQEVLFTLALVKNNSFATVIPVHCY